MKKNFIPGKATILHVDLMNKALRWPRQMVFPFLDIARLALLNKSFQQVLMSSESGALEFIDVITPHITDTNVEHNQKLALQIINNVFACTSGDKAINCLNFSKYLLFYVIFECI